MRGLTEPLALARLQRLKARYQTHIKQTYERRAEDCRTCPTRGICCTDAHFVNVHITRLEAVSIQLTLERTPRLTLEARRKVYSRAREVVALYSLRASGDTFAQTYSCPLFEPRTGCLVHRRAKPAPCIQHACYENWEDLPPDSLQTRAEHRVEQLNRAVYGAAWAWLPTPLWLTLVDPEADTTELETLIKQWNAEGSPGKIKGDTSRPARQLKRDAQHSKLRLPVLNQSTSRF